MALLKPGQLGKPAENFGTGNWFCWFAFLAILIWSLNYVCLKYIFQTIPVPASIFIRYLVMWAMLLILCRLKGDKTPYDKKTWWIVLYVGFINMGAYMVVFMNGMNLTQPAEGAVVFASAPVLTAIGACLIGKEKWRITVVAGLILGLAGIAIVEFGGHGLHGLHLGGNIIVFLAAIIWAHGALMMPGLQKQYSSTRLFALCMPGALPILLVYCLMPTLHANWGAVSLVSWLALAYHVIASGLLGFLLFYKAIEKIGPSNTTRYQMLLPILTGIFAAILWREEVGVAFVAGSALVIAGLFVAGIKQGLNSKVCLD